MHRDQKKTHCVSPRYGVTRVMVLSCAMVLSCIMVLTRVMMLANGVYNGVSPCYHCYGVNSCYDVSPCYGVILCYGVSPFYAVSPCYTVSPCYVTFAWVTQPEHPKGEKDKVKQAEGPPARSPAQEGPYTSSV